MSDDKDILGDRRKALEESFFRKENDRLRSQLAAKMEAEENKKAFRELFGLTDEDALDALVEAGMTRGTLAALSLVPLVEVAWADGDVDDKERKAIVDAAAERGLSKDGDAMSLLDDWLGKRPPSDLREAWAAYVKALVGCMGDEARAAVKADIMGKAKDVAERAGGFLGIATVSSEERSMLDELSKAFD